MANARMVVAACLDEAVRLAGAGGRVSIDGETHVPADRLHSLLLLAREALEAGDGEIPDERVRQAGLTPSPD